MKEVFEKIVEKLSSVGGCDDCCEYNKGIDSAIDTAISIVQEVEKEYNNGWIPCSERLPEECIEVLVSVQEIDGSTYTRTSWMQDGIWVIKKTPLHPTVIAWQPLPEPYKEKERSKQLEIGSPV